MSEDDGVVEPPRQLQRLAAQAPALGGLTRRMCRGTGHAPRARATVGLPLQEYPPDGPGTAAAGPTAACRRWPSRSLPRARSPRALPARRRPLPRRRLTTVHRSAIPRSQYIAPAAAPARPRSKSRSMRSETLSRHHLVKRCEGGVHFLDCGLKGKALAMPDPQPRARSRYL